jgi:hypothetical protein
MEYHEVLKKLNRRDRTAPLPGFAGELFQKPML